MLIQFIHINRPELLVDLIEYSFARLLLLLKLVFETFFEHLVKGLFVTFVLLYFQLNCLELLFLFNFFRPMLFKSLYDPFSPLFCSFHS